MKVRFVFNDYSLKLEIWRIFYTTNNCDYNSDINILLLEHIKSIEPYRYRNKIPISVFVCVCV